MQKDPIIQMQMKELQIKEQAQKAKEKEAQMRQQIEAKKSEDRKQIEQAKLAQKQREEQAKLIAELVTEYMKTQNEQRKQTTKEAAEGVRLGIDMAGKVIEASQREKDRALRREEINKDDGGNG